MCLYIPLAVSIVLGRSYEHVYTSFWYPLRVRSIVNHNWVRYDCTAGSHAVSLFIVVSDYRTSISQIRCIPPLTPYWTDDWKDCALTLHTR
jgi:hypothetical protein